MTPPPAATAGGTRALPRTAVPRAPRRVSGPARPNRRDDATHASATAATTPRAAPAPAAPPPATPSSSARCTARSGWPTPASWTA